MIRPPDAASDPVASRAGAEPELKAIVSDLWQNSERLVQQELQLAVSELDLRVERAKAALRRGAIAGGLFHAAYLTTLATLVLLLSEVLAPWLASLLVAVIASAGAYLFSRRAKQMAQAATQSPPTREPLMSSRHTAHS